MPKHVGRKRLIVRCLVFLDLGIASVLAVLGAFVAALLVAFPVSAIGADTAAGFVGYVIMIVGGVVVGVAYLRSELRLSMARRRAVGARRTSAFGRVGRLLPVEVRDEYCEEWAAWMEDLRAGGTPRVRRWLELLSLVLIGVPRLAIDLRVAAVRRAVDR